MPLTSPRAHKRRATSAKARAQKSNRRARDVASMARSGREMHAPGGGKADDVRLPARFGETARARVRARILCSIFLLGAADPPEILLRSRWELQENGF